MHTGRTVFRWISAFPWIPALFLLALSMSAPSFAGEPEEKVTTVFLVRHAEKDSIPAGDPPLSTQGRERAEALARLMGKAGITSIVTTEMKRTKETAEPLANILGISPTVIPVIWAPSTPRKVSPRFYTALAEHIRKNGGGTILVVGHSNTIPELIRVLGGPADIKIGETEFDLLYTMVLSGESVIKGFDLRYGK